MLNIFVNFKLEIYNRWGNQIFFAEDFSAGDSSFGWNGRKNNQDAVIGVYVYLVVALLPNGEEVTSVGDVTLVR